MEQYGFTEYSVDSFSKPVYSVVMMANSVGSDQTAPWGALWSGSALFAQIYLPRCLEFLRLYCDKWVSPEIKLFLHFHEKFSFTQSVAATQYIVVLFNMI